MLAIYRRAAGRCRLCDTWSRRELLAVGSLGLVGLGLSGFLRRAAAQQTGGAAAGGFGRARSVILLYLQGSPSHIDLWDPKPDAPSAIRGEFATIASNVPGISLSEALPQLARQADKFALVRSLGVDPKGLRNHGAAIYMLLTGHSPLNFSPTGLSVPPSPEDLPAIGAVVSRYRPAEAGSLSNAALCGPVREGSVAGVAQYAGVLGAAHNPFTIYDDPTQPLTIEGFRPPADVTLGRLQARLDLRAAVDELAPSRRAAGYDAYFDQAVSLVTSGSVAAALRLDDEPRERRERYGMTRFGQSVLLARRLVEAGTRFVQVNWPAGSDTEPAEGPDGSWDTHRNNFPMLRQWRCPVFDQALSALLEDMAASGLLAETLVLAIGEFGRSPVIGAPTTDNVGPGGRDHWPECYTCLFAGGGVQGGRVYGESDRDGAYPRRDSVHPYDVVSTIYHALGIDVRTEYHDALDRPRRLVEHGGPIRGLF